MNDKVLREYVSQKVPFMHDDPEVVEVYDRLVDHVLNKVKRDLSTHGNTAYVAQASIAVRTAGAGWWGEECIRKVQMRRLIEKQKNNKE